jgi:hypothetical protein
MKKTTVFLVRTPAGIIPAGDEDAEKLSAVALDSMFKAVISQPRNVQKHRKLFVMLRKIHANWPENTEGRPENDNKLLDVVKMITGHVEYLTVSGQVFAVPASISFDEMDEIEFDSFFRAVQNWGESIIGFDPAV